MIVHQNDFRSCWLNLVRKDLSPSIYSYLDVHDVSKRTPLWLRTHKTKKKLKKRFYNSCRDTMRKTKRIFLKNYEEQGRQKQLLKRRQQNHGDLVLVRWWGSAWFKGEQRSDEFLGFKFDRKMLQNHSTSVLLKIAPLKRSGSLFFEKSGPEMFGGSLFFENFGSAGAYFSEKNLPALRAGSYF